MKWHSWLIIAALTTILLIVDGGAAWSWNYNFMGREQWRWLFALLLGGSVAQVNLIAIWASLAPGRVALRLPWSIFLAALMWYALVLGNLWWIDPSSGDLMSPVHGPAMSLSSAVLLGIILLVSIVTVQVPLWAMSRWFGWRLMSPSSTITTGESERQFNLRHLIAGMVLASLALGMGRIILPPGEMDTPSLDRELTIILPAILVVNLIAIVPCIWIAFARPAILLIPLAIGWLFWAVIVSLVEIATLSAFLGPPPLDVWFYFTLFNIAQGMCVLVSLIVLRRAGFRLLRPTTGEKSDLPIVTARSPSDIMQASPLPPTTTITSAEPR